MPRKRKSQRGGEYSLTAVDPMSIVIGVILLVVIVGIMYFLRYLIQILHDHDPEPDPEPDPVVYSGPMKTMREVLTDCNVDLNVEEIDIDSANMCIQNYLKNPTITSYEDVYDSTLLEGLTNFIKNTKMNLLEDDVVNGGTTRINNAMNQLIGTIENYDGSSSILCLNDRVTDCQLIQKRDPDEINQAESVSSILKNIHTCVTSNVSCDNIIPEDPHDYVTEHDGYSRIRALKEIFLYEREDNP